MTDPHFGSRQAQAGGKGKPRRGMATITDLVKRWMKENKVKQRVGEGSLFDRWREVVGEEIAAQTRVVDVKNGELLVEVASASLLNELSTYYGEEILQSLRGREEFRGVYRIKFKAGAF